MNNVLNNLGLAYQLSIHAHQINHKEYGWGVKSSYSLQKEVSNFDPLPVQDLLAGMMQTLKLMSSFSSVIFCVT